MLSTYALNYLSKHCMLEIKIWRLAHCEEELASICVLAFVGHRKQARLVMRQRRVKFVLKCFSEYGFAA